MIRGIFLSIACTFFLVNQGMSQCSPIGSESTEVVLVPLTSNQNTASNEGVGSGSSRIYTGFNPLNSYTFQLNNGPGNLSCRQGRFLDSSNNGVSGWFNVSSSTTQIAPANTAKLQIQTTRSSAWNSTSATLTYRANTTVTTPVSITGTVTGETCTADNNGSITGVSLDDALTNVRYIKLTQRRTSDNHINLAELRAFEVFSGTNVALGATVTSNVGAYPGWPYDGLTDGATGSSGADQAHTGSAAFGNYLQVDLGSGRDLDYIQVLNRNGCCYIRASNLLLELFDASGLLVYSNVISLPNSSLGTYTQNVLDVTWSDAATTLNRSGLDQGTYTLSYSDVSGNSGSNAFVVGTDVTPPTAICQNISVDLDATGNASITAGMIDNGSNDACGIASLSVSPSSFTCANVGANSVTLTVTDNSGNTNTCTATVTVNDVTPPTAVCQNISVDLDAIGSANISASDINNGSSDVCGIASLSVSPSSFTCANVGANTVTLTVTDNNGNSSTCTATVTVNDVTPPAAICQNIAVTLDASGNASISPSDIDNGSSDACGIASMSVSQTTFNCADHYISPISVTLTVTDNNGNSNTCTSLVFVNQDESSVAPTGITASSNFICLGESVTLSVDGGSLGAGATWEWYDTSCGGTPVGSGPSIVVSPTSSSVYVVRGESICGTVNTSCTGPELVIVNAATTPPIGATLPTAPGTYSSTCTINDALTHYMYDSNGNLLGAINSNGENLGDVTFTIEVGNNGPYGTGFPPGVCGYTGVTDGEYALARNWDIQITGSNPPANPSTVTFYYLGSEVTDLSTTIAGLPYSADYVQCWGNVTTEADLMMTVHHTGGSTELFTSITPAAGPGAGLRELGFNLSEFSQGFLHSSGGITGANNALPVELLSWEAKAIENSYVHLSWSTATEINNAGFELLRSTDGENFEAIAWVEGNNNSTEIQEYSYNDNKVNVGTYYYQLKQVDHNGDYEYFDVLSATIKGTESTIVGDVYPNPTDRDITIAISSVTDASINVQVFNYVGQEVLTQNAQIRTGNNQLKVNTATLPEGAYYAVFQIGDELFTKKFVVIK